MPHPFAKARKDASRVNSRQKPHFSQRTREMGHPASGYMSIPRTLIGTWIALLKCGKYRLTFSNVSEPSHV